MRPSCKSGDDAACRWLLSPRGQSLWGEAITPVIGQERGKAGARGSRGGALPPRWRAATRRAARLPQVQVFLGWEMCFLHLPSCRAASSASSCGARGFPGCGVQPGPQLWVFGTVGSRGWLGACGFPKVPVAATPPLLKLSPSPAEPNPAELSPCACCVTHSGFNLGGKNILLGTLVESRGPWPPSLAPALAFGILAPVASFPSPPTSQALALWRGNFPAACN